MGSKMKQNNPDWKKTGRNYLYLQMTWPCNRKSYPSTATKQLLELITRLDSKAAGPWRGFHSSLLSSVTSHHCLPHILHPSNTKLFCFWSQACTFLPGYAHAVPSIWDVFPTTRPPLILWFNNLFSKVWLTTKSPAPLIWVWVKLPSLLSHNTLSLSPPLCLPSHIKILFVCAFSPSLSNLWGQGSLYVL